jgi:streptomycin 6-kinase
MPNIKDELAHLSLGHLGPLNEPIAFAAAGDVEGRAWIAGLPALIDTVCQRWGLEVVDGVAHNGYHAVVLPVQRGGEQYVLKLTWLADRTIDEARALATWNGHGAVRMFEADTEVGVLLLERLDSQRTLRDLDLIEAAAVAGRLLRQLVVPAPPGFRKLHDLASDITRSLDARQERLGHPVPTEWLEGARALCQQLANDVDHPFLVHADLHYGNVLAGEREPWLAIDPKPVAGHPEYAVPELLWTRVDDVDGTAGVRRLLAVLIDNGTLDADKAHSWAIVRCVDYWLWGVENGLTADPKRCRCILEALV